MAEGSAIASMAAHKQGKFFEMVDKLYADTRKQDKATLEGYAKAIGLDVEQYKKDVLDPEAIRYVRMDQKAGSSIGVGGTPAMYLNGRSLQGRTLEAMKKAVEKEIAEVDKLVKGGLSVVDARNKRVESAAAPAKAKWPKTGPSFGQAYLDWIVNRKPSEVSLAPPKEAPPAPVKKAPKPVDKTVKNVPIFPGDPLKGPLDALVTIVECTDFQ